MHFITVPARQVLHWFECDRPGQMRGIPKITASLPLFSQLRRFTLATLTAAEFAAMLAGVMKTNLPAANGAAASIDRWELVELVRGALVTLPEQWDAQQFEPRQPTANYGDFKRELLNEAGRGPGAPLNVVTGNSSGYNFSSGRLDHLPYQRGIRIDRDDLRTIVLDPTFIAW
jgi:capsid protein